MADAPRANAKLTKERIEALIQWPHALPDFVSALRELLAARESIEALREAVVEALQDWDYASTYKGDYLRKKHGDEKRIAELRALIGLNADGTWADSALAKQGGATE